MRQTYPGWNGTPGRETHPLQSCWIHNIKEEVGAKQVDPFYGKNVWPSDGLKHKFTAMNECMCDAAPPRTALHPHTLALASSSGGPLEPRDTPNPTPV